MRLAPQVCKKAALATVLSTCLISAFVTPSFAAVDVNSLTNKIGNELQAEFNVTEADAEDTVVLSWDEEALDIALESYNLTTDEAQTVTYYVSPGADNDDDLTVSILLKLPAVSADAVSELQVDNQTISSSFTDAGFSYYVLNERLEISAGDDGYSDTFDIAFDTATAGTPFGASLIAVDASTNVRIEIIDYDTGPLSTYGTGTTQDEIWFHYSTEDEIENGIITINLGTGITGIATYVDENPSTPDDEYGYYFDGNGVHSIKDQYDPATKTVTLPISGNTPGDEYKIVLYNVSLANESGTYSIRFAMDPDGEGTTYTEAEEMLPLELVDF